MVASSSYRKALAVINHTTSGYSRLLSLPCKLPSLRFLQQILPQTDRRRGNFDQLILFDVFQRLLQGHLPGRFQDNALVGAGGADVGQLLFAADVDGQVVIAAVFAHDLAFVDLFAAGDEQAAALLQVVEGVGGGPAGLGGDHDAVGPAGNAAAHRLVIEEVVVHDGLAAGAVHEPRAQTNQTTGRDGEFDVRHFRPAIELETFGPAIAHQLHHRPHVSRRHLDHKVFDGLEGFAADFFGDDARFAHAQLEAFAAHVLDEDGQVQQAAAGDVELLALLGAGDDAQGDIGFQLSHKAIAQLPAGDIGPFLAGKRRIVDAEVHVQGRLVDLDGRQGHGLIEVGHGVADVHFLQADHGADVAGGNLVRLDPAQAIENVKLDDGVIDTATIALQ